MRRFLLSMVLALSALVATAVSVGANSWPSGCC